MRKFIFMKKSVSILSMVGLLLISASFTFAKDTLGLSDIAGHKNQQAIEYLYENKVISGYPDGTFKPDNTVNRAELLKILVGGKKITPTIDQYKNCFPDVHVTDWFTPYVCYAKNSGWVDGYPDKTFKPNQKVTKVEAIKMLVNSQGFDVPTIVQDSLFDDVNNQAWYAPFLKVAKEKGLLEQINGTYGVANFMSRGEISENIYRAMILPPEANSISPDSQTTPTVNTPVPSNVSQQIAGLASIGLSTFMKSWDADAQDDGIEVSINYYDSGRKNISDYTTVKVPISADIKLYTGKDDGHFNTVKDRLVFSKHFASGDAIATDSIYTVFRIPREEMTTNANDPAFGVLEVTIHTPEQGDFSAIEDTLTKVLFDD